jgi:transketolase
MRRILCQALVKAASRPELVFLTGDLGFMALEPLRDALGPRFLNAGVAEQNMVSVAAGLAKTGLRPWIYSIAPFLYARPFEQIRNDVCLHDVPVVLVGNGGGYAYGVMGPTHHGLEDYGALLCLPHLRAFIPAFDADVFAVVDRLFSWPHPAYLRLGVSEEPRDMTLPTYAPWRKLLDGQGPTVVVVGPLGGGILRAARELPEPRRPDLWLLSELPCDNLPPEFLDDLQRSDSVLVVEEHVAHGGAGQMLAHRLLIAGRVPRCFRHRAARGYPSGRYGSQQFHRQESGLDPPSIVAALLT